MVAATERIGGLQAQEPASPHIGLWTRLAGFEPAELDRAILDRTVVKGTLMRSTLHLVSAADYLHLWPAIVPELDGIRRRDRAQPPSPRRLATLRARAEAFTAEPRGLGELRDHLGPADGLAPDEIVWWVRRSVAFAHAPSEVPWSFGRRPRLAHALAWLGADGWPAVADALERLVRRYLGAFGPATAADLAQWSGLAVGKLRPGIAAVDAAGDLRRFSDERGRELLDIDGAPLPDADTPAPPRLLPMWDSTVLAFADRTRLISDADRRVVIARNGDTLPTFTVDGVVAGLWWAEADRWRPDADRHRALPAAASTGRCPGPRAGGGAAGRRGRTARTERVQAIPAVAPRPGRHTLERMMDDWLRAAVGLAAANATEGGFPFGALVVRDGAVLATGVNTVLRDADPSAHAEVQAIRAACREVGTLRLDGATVISSCEPCPMCQAVAAIAGVPRIVYAATAEIAAEAGFRLPPAAAAMTAAGRESLASSSNTCRRRVRRRPSWPGRPAATPRATTRPGCRRGRSASCDWRSR